MITNSGGFAYFLALRSPPTIKTPFGETKFAVIFTFTRRDTTVYLFLADVWKLKLPQVLIARRRDTVRLWIPQGVWCDRRFVLAQIVWTTLGNHRFQSAIMKDWPRLGRICWCLFVQFYFDISVVHEGISTFSPRALFKVWNITFKSLRIIYRVFT